MSNEQSQAPAVTCNVMDCDTGGGNMPHISRHHTLPTVLQKQSSPQHSPAKVYSGPTLVASNVQSIPVTSQLPDDSGASVEFTVGDSLPVVHNVIRSTSHPVSTLKQRNRLSYDDPNKSLPMQLEHRRYSTPEDLKSVYRKKLYSVKEDNPLIGYKAPQQYGGYDYQFLDPQEITDNLTCPICHLVFNEPYLTDCCGAQFCKSCIQPICNDAGVCPLCCKNFTTMVNRQTERQVNALNVKCPQSGMGCDWVGHLGGLINHLHVGKGGCQYLMVPCPDCNATLPLNSLDDHKTNDCPKRRYICKFCYYEGIYEEMPTTHWPVCEGYPVSCPNKCQHCDMPRRNLQAHILECNRRVIGCDFEYAGCDIKLPQDEREMHMKDNVQNHLALVSKLVKHLIEQQAADKNRTETALITIKNNENEILGLKKEVDAKEKHIDDLTQQVAQLQKQCDDCQLEVAVIKSTLHQPPFHFTLENFSSLSSSQEQWFSIPFYTHKEGYKMCMSVDCNGSDEGTGTHVSVYAYLMMGEFDSMLNWPFRGILSVRLYNQRSDSRHIDHTIPFSRDIPEDIAGPIKKKIAESGVGIPKFIDRSQLGHNFRTNAEYLKNNCLKLCVLTVKLMS